MHPLSGLTSIILVQACCQKTYLNQKIFLLPRALGLLHHWYALSKISCYQYLLIIPGKYHPIKYWKISNYLFAEIIITQVILKTLVSRELDKGPIRTELVDVVKEDTEICSITQANSQ